MLKKYSYLLGILVTTIVSLASLPLQVLMVLFGMDGMTSHSTPTSNEIWGCSQFPDSCTGPRYYITVIAAIVMIGSFFAVGYIGQKVAQFPNNKLAVGILTIYSSVVVFFALTLGFMVISPG